MERFNRRIPELDGLRGIAIAIVVLFHARPDPASLFSPFPILHTLIGLGPNGVDLFFVLSGFLITGILLDTKSSPAYFRSFYIRRALRILPLYLFAVAAFFFVTLPWLHHIGELLDVNGSEQVWYWFFLMNWHDAAGHIIDPLIHFWSLGIEEQFYLVWPLIIFFCSARYFPVLCISICAFSLAVRVALVSGNSMAPELLGEWIHRATITRIDTLAVGALVAVLVRRPNWAQAALSWGRVVAPAAFAAFILCWLAGQALSTLLNTLGYTAIAVGFGCTVLVSVTGEGSSQILCRIARLRVLQSMGRYSYGMYLLHISVRNLCVRPFLYKIVFPFLVHHPPLRRIAPLWLSLFILAMSLAASYLAALVSWNLLEKHFLRLKDRFSYQVTTQEIPIAVVASTS